MATVLQIVDESDTVLFDLNGTNGVDAGSVTCSFGVGGEFNLGAPDPELVTVSPPSQPGGSVVYRRDPLVSSGWRQRIEADSYDELVQGIGELARLLAAGGILKWVPDGSSETRYIDFEPSPAPALFGGRSLELFHAVQLFQAPSGVPLQIIRQPYLRAAELDPAVNVLTNSTMLIDVDADSQPDGFAWTSATPISAEDIDVAEEAYEFTITAGTQSLRQVYVGGTAADVWTDSVYAKSSSGTARIAMDVIFRNSGGTAVGTAIGGTTTLTSAWQRLSGTGTAPANTAQVVFSPRVHAAVAATVLMRRGQLEEASAATAYRTGAEVVAYDPAATSSAARMMPVVAWGNAPTLAKFQITADAQTLAEAHVYRVSQNAVQVLQSTLYKQLEGGSLGTMTGGTADAAASGGSAAAVVYTEPDPSFGADDTDSGTGATITIPAPASIASGNVLVAFVLRRQSTAQLLAPVGWELIGFQEDATANLTLFAWLKVADEIDEDAASYEFKVVFPTGGLESYRGWIGRFADVDQDSPLETFDFATESATTAATAPSLTTAADDAMIVLAIAAELTAGSGTISFTAPAGTTPTYTERDDGGTDQTWIGGAVYTGVLASAGATGTKDVTVSGTADCIMAHIALRKAPAAMATRSTVTWGSADGLVAGDYDVWLRYRVTAACKDRIRVGYGLMSSPSVWHDFPDVIVNTLAASSFDDYQEHLFGRIHIPGDFDLDTLTIRVQSGREETSSSDLRLDFLALAPAFEHVGVLRSPTVLADGEHLYSDAEAAAAFHLASDEDLAEVAEVAGPAPVELVPGTQVLYIFGLTEAASGFVDRVGELGATPTVAVTHEPEYRT